MNKYRAVVEVTIEVEAEDAEKARLEAEMVVHRLIPQKTETVTLIEGMRAEGIKE